jgi:hypothetical protein
LYNFKKTTIMQESKISMLTFDRVENLDGI